jgi:hypothetical protein
MNEARFHEPALDEREDVIGVFFGGPREWGGKIIITNRRCFFAPIDVGLVDTILTYVGGQAGIPSADLAGTIIDRVRTAAKKEVWLRHVEAVEPRGNGASSQLPRSRSARRPAKNSHSAWSSRPGRQTWTRRIAQFGTRAPHCC